MFEAFAALLVACQDGGTVVRRDGRHRFPARVTAGSPVPPDDLTLLETWLGRVLPADYRTFLQRWDGAQLFAIQSAYGVDNHPSLFAARVVPGSQEFLEDPRVLVIGMLDDEAYFLLDRRHPDAAQWPVYWADESDTAESALARPPIAAGFAQFIERYVAAQGEAYWEPPPPPLAWQSQPAEGPFEERWVHGLGIGLNLERHGRLLYRLYYPNFDPYGLTPEALLLAVGLRQHLLALGARALDPASLSWEPLRSAWLFTFPPGQWPRLDPRTVPPAPTPWGWQEIAAGLWVHGAEGSADAALVVRRFLAHGRHDGSYELGWRTGPGEAVVEPLRRRLAALAQYVTTAKYLPDDHEAERYHWWKADEPPPDVQPLPAEPR